MIVFIMLLNSDVMHGYCEISKQFF